MGHLQKVGVRVVLLPSSRLEHHLAVRKVDESPLRRDQLEQRQPHKTEFMVPGRRPLARELQADGPKPHRSFLGRDSQTEGLTEVPEASEKLLPVREQRHGQVRTPLV